jgi:hypothetical protein
MGMESGTVKWYYGITVLRYYGITVLRYYGITVLRYYGNNLHDLRETKE